MSLRQFKLILNYVRKDLQFHAANALSPEEQLGLFLMVVGQGETFNFFY